MKSNKHQETHKPEKKLRTRLPGPIVGNILKRGANISTKIKTRKTGATEQQEATFTKMLTKAKNTSFGRHYKFAEILKSDDPVKLFKSRVPLVDYDGMHPWWRRAEMGELDVAWPGRVKYFALSSGTSGAPSKNIPVTKDMVRAIRRASIRQMITLSKYDLDNNIYQRQTLTLSGSTSLQDHGNHFKGDVSGINVKHMPPLVRSFTKPTKKISLIRDWEERLQLMVKDAPKWDIGILAGVPAWMNILMERIEQRYGVESIHDIWPNLEVYLHGGVAIAPYVETLNKHFRKKVHYVETYLASEGFVAQQTYPDSKGMELLTNNWIYFEFIPFDSAHMGEDGLPLDPFTPTLSLEEVEVGRSYAIVMSTCSGAWRYLIGDVVKFVSLDKPELIIDGRTKHFLSLVGEHLSVDNMTQGVVNTSKHFGQIFEEFSVAGLAEDGEFGHHWFIACDVELDANQVQERLDEEIKALNDDYIVEREHALKNMYVTLVPTLYFNEFLAAQGKQGGQIKFPRVIKGAQFEAWKQFLVDKGIAMPY